MIDKQGSLYMMKDNLISSQQTSSDGVRAMVDVI